MNKQKLIDMGMVSNESNVKIELIKGETNYIKKLTAGEMADFKSTLFK